MNLKDLPSIKQIEKGLSKLSLLERKIFTLKYGINSEPHTDEEISKKLNITLTKIKKIKESAITNLRRNTTKLNLRKGLR